MNNKTTQRCIDLAHTLATANDTEALCDLCEAWGIKPKTVGAEGLNGKPLLLVWPTVRRLAKHAIDESGDGNK